MKSRLLGLMFSLVATMAHATPVALEGGRSAETVFEVLQSYRVAADRTCKSVSSCQEAVELWCGGYSRADADRDGIPCESVCSSKRQVDEIKAQIGC